MMDVALFKEAMSRFPSGIVIATTTDAGGKPWGFTASSFSSVSVDPPLVLVCLAKTAECYQAFNSAHWFAINVLGAGDAATAAKFARRGADKFAGASVDADEHGSPLLPSSVAALTCQKFDAYDCGDHDVIVGRVTAIRVGSDVHPMVYSSRQFGRFAVDPKKDLPAPQLGNPSAGIIAGGESIRHCVRCGSDVVSSVPPGDRISRHVCCQCGHIHYINPIVVVGCVAEAPDGRILMCRRRTSPRQGYWTFPSGFLECGESGDEGARREAFEEAQAEVQIEGLLCLIDVPQVNEVHLIYRGSLRAATLLPTAESSEVALMDAADIPWENLAFTSVGESLRCYFADRLHRRKRVHMLDLRTAPQDENCDAVSA
jgi:flavin reductase (DIM6/NTAB) family NADH-FMN oxidoreductase RutF/ADP-ribose pyrophosphatase YjhB (NUDIX family)